VGSRAGEGFQVKRIDLLLGRLRPGVTVEGDAVESSFVGVGTNQDGEPGKLAAFREERVVGEDNFAVRRWVERRD